MDIRATCQPALPGMDWDRLASTPIVLIGAGAVGRPLADSLAHLGFRRFLIVDPKTYRERSIASQCEPNEVGECKATVVAQELSQFGVEATGLAADVFDIEPGRVDPDAIVAVSADNRRGDIGANRLAAMMRARLVKVNVEPLLLAASVRCYDLRGESPDVCLQCQMTESQYAEQQHPESCDGGETSRPTGSPRALCRLAANAAALVIAQLAGSANHLAPRWFGRQWLVNFVTGQACLSLLGRNENCRWQHGTHWPNLRRLNRGPQDTTLADLLALTGFEDDSTRIRFSAPVATQAHCPRCGPVPVFRWQARLSDAVETCSCGAAMSAVPFFCFESLPVREIPKRDESLAAWGVPPWAIISVEREDRAFSFVIGGGDGTQQSLEAEKRIANPRPDQRGTAQSDVAATGHA